MLRPFHLYPSGVTIAPVSSGHLQKETLLPRADFAPHARDSEKWERRLRFGESSRAGTTLLRSARRLARRPAAAAARVSLSLRACARALARVCIHALPLQLRAVLLMLLVMCTMCCMECSTVCVAAQGAGHGSYASTRCSLSFSRMSHRLPRVLPRVRCAVHTFVAWMSMASCWLLSLSCAPASHGSLVWWRSLPRCRLARLAIAPCGHPFLLTSRLSFETFNQVSCFRCLQAYAATHQAGACACSAALLLTLLLCSASCDWMATRSWCT